MNLLAAGGWRGVNRTGPRGAFREDVEDLRRGRVRSQRRSGELLRYDAFHGYVHGGEAGPGAVEISRIMGQLRPSGRRNFKFLARMRMSSAAAWGRRAPRRETR